MGGPSVCESSCYRVDEAFIRQYVDVANRARKGDRSAFDAWLALCPRTEPGGLSRDGGVRRLARPSGCNGEEVVTLPVTNQDDVLRGAGVGGWRPTRRGGQSACPSRRRALCAHDACTQHEALGRHGHDESTECGSARAHEVLNRLPRIAVGREHRHPQRHIRASAALLRRVLRWRYAD